MANLSVGEIRRRFRDRLDIDPQSQAFINGQAVSNDTVVRAGQVLSFTQLAGANGTDAPFSEELEFLMHGSDDPEVPTVRRRSRRREPRLSWPAGDHPRRFGARALAGRGRGVCAGGRAVSRGDGVDA